MSRFTFPLADAKAEQFCWEIVLIMTGYGISKSEALRRINEHWKGQTIGGKIGDKDDYGWLVYHEDPGYWATVILGGKR
jgi:hypothetical protein